MKKIKVLINEEQINERLDELATQIMEDYKEKDIMFLCILKGSVIFTVELAKRIKNNVQFEFIEVSSYECNKSTGKIKLNKDITQSIERKDVIIIEDIIDSGRTIKLLDKPSKRTFEIEADYIGFTVKDEFIVGYGLDDEQNLRNLNYIGYIEE